MTVTETYPADSDLCETEDIVSTTVYKYDADGKQISNYRKEFTGSCHNYLSGHCFENLDAWTAESANTVDSILVHCRETDKSKFGDYVLRMQTLDKNVVANGVYQTVTLPVRDIHSFGISSPDEFIEKSEYLYTCYVIRRHNTCGKRTSE